MKILYLCPDLGIPVLGRKGASVHVREFAAALARAGHRVTLAAQTFNKSPWEKPATLDVPAVQVRPSPAASAAVQALKELNELFGVENSLPGELRRLLYNRELVEDLKRRFENDPPDFIYERASLYATAGVMLASQFGVPLIVELNAPLAIEQTAYRATGFGELAAHAERWTLSRADAVVVVSPGLRRHALSLGVLRPERIHVMPNGVNPSLFQPGKPDRALRRELKLDGRPVLGFVGNLRPWHGVEALPQLMERLSRRHRKLRLVIAGDGQLRRDLERDFSKRGLRDCAVFTGSMLHEQIPAVIRQFDVALAPYPKSDHDFYFSPLKIFEYMACGVPVVAANLGQIPEIVTDGKTGLLYPAGDLDALTSCCDKLLRSSKLRIALGRAASKRVHARYTWDQNAERIIELARGLMAARRK
jgi:glycosyltransferase involved in cell wall biosynthesis